MAEEEREAGKPKKLSGPERMLRIVSVPGGGFKMITDGRFTIGELLDIGNGLVDNVRRMPIQLGSDDKKPPPPGS